MILPSYSPKQSGNFGGTFPKFSTVLQFYKCFRKQFSKTEYPETFSTFQINRINSLGYFKTIILPGSFHKHLCMDISPRSSGPHILPIYTMTLIAHSLSIKLTHRAKPPLSYLIDIRIVNYTGTDSSHLPAGDWLEK
jgi:hypothetical protein